MRIYLDNCCFNRPYDDQSNLRNSIEAQAKLRIQELIKDGTFELASSYMLQFENAQNPHEMRREAIESFIRTNMSIHIGDAQKDKLSETLKDIEATGVKNGDAVHVASAIEAGCTYLLTTDDRLLKYKSEKIKIVNPVDFILLEVENDEQ